MTAPVEPAASPRSRRRPQLSRRSKPRTDPPASTEETQIVTVYSSLAVADWENAATGYEAQSAQNADAAQALAEAADRADKAAAKDDGAANDGEARIKRLLDDAEAEATRVLQKAKDTAGQIRGEVTRRRDNATRLREEAQQNRETARWHEGQSTEAARAALFVRASAERARREHNIVDAAPAPNPAAVERFNTFHDAQDAAEAEVGRVTT